MLFHNREPPACDSPAVPWTQREAWSFPAALAAAPDAPVASLAVTDGCGSGGGTGVGVTCKATWASAVGVCAARSASTGEVCSPALLRRTDSFVDYHHADGAWTAVFDFDSHVIVGADTSTSADVPQFYERVPRQFEPTQALDGGVRYYPTLVLVDPAYAAEESGGARADAFAEDFAREDMPRLMQVVPPEAIVLLPRGAAGRVAAHLSDAFPGSDVPRGLTSWGGGTTWPNPSNPEAWAAQLRYHIVEQEAAANVLHYARDVFVYGCSCA